MILVEDAGLQPRKRATFSAEELAVALSHYDLGIVESVTDFPRGSSRSPKVGIVCQRGKFLLKRRSAVRAQPDRVEFIHTVQKHLAASGFPVPRIITARDTGRALLQIRDCVYELFEYVPGHPYRQTTGEALEAGIVLARFHKLTEEIAASPTSPRGGYHDNSVARNGLCTIDSTLTAHDSFTGDDAALATLIQYLLEAYDQAAESVNQLGLPTWTERLIHADWHPGNLLFRNEKAVAVIDYDGLRAAQRMIDVGNGALQFSMTAGGDPATWPDHLDQERFDAFVSGYTSHSSLSEKERACLVHLMIEALIAECVPPITETGSVGRWAGYRVLQMVRRKVSWMKAQAEKLVAVAGDR